MSCQVTRDNNGKIIKVLDSQGKESKLFNQIAQLPHVASLEQAVEIYDEVLKANFKPIDRYTLPKSAQEVLRLRNEAEQVIENMTNYRRATAKLTGTSYFSKSYAWDNFDKLIGISGITIKEDTLSSGTKVFRAFSKDSDTDWITSGLTMKDLEQKITDTEEFYAGIQESILKEAGLTESPDRSISSMIDHLIANYEDSVSEAIKKNSPVYPEYGIDIKTMGIEDVYPIENNPHLYKEDAFGDMGKFPKLTGQSASLLFRGIHPSELEFIRKNGYIQSDQSYNLGDEVEAGVTVYATAPRTAFSYSSGFAPEGLRPTEGNPNYILMIQNDPSENKAVTDVIDGYVKVKKAIPSNKIFAIYSVDEKGDVKNVSEEILSDIFDASALLSPSQEAALELTTIKPGESVYFGESGTIGVVKEILKGSYSYDYARALLTNGVIVDLMDGDRAPANSEKSDNYTRKESIIKKLDTIGSSKSTVVDHKSNKNSGKGRFMLAAYSSESLEVLENYVKEIEGDTLKIFETAIDYGAVIVLSVYDGKANYSVIVGDSSDFYHARYDYVGERDGVASETGLQRRSRKTNVPTASVISGIKKWAEEYNTIPEDTLKKVDQKNVKSKENRNARATKSVTPAEEIKLRRKARYLPPVISKLFENKASASSLVTVYPKDSRWYPIVAQLSQATESLSEVTLEWQTDKESESSAGLYISGSNTIKLAERSQTPQSVIAHELVHAVTNRAISKYGPDYGKGVEYIAQLKNLIQKSKNSTNETKKAVAKIAELYIEAIEKSGKSQRTIDSLNTRLGIVDAEYGFTNLDEFVAEALTNKRFQDILNNIKTDNGTGTLWSKLMDIISDLLVSYGYPRVIDGSILEELIKQVNTLIENQNKGFLAENEAGELVPETTLRSPNRESELTQEEAIESEAFKTWFGDSKVVDENGKPLVVHHGGLGTISTFSEDFGGQTTADNKYGAFYFSDQDKVAEDYSRQAFIRMYEDNLEGLIEDGIIPSDTNLEEIEDSREYVRELAEERMNVASTYISMKNPFVINADYKSLRELEQTYNIQEIIGTIKGKASEFVDEMYEGLAYSQDDLDNYSDEIAERARENNSLEEDEEVEEYMIEEATEEIMQENGIELNLPEYDGLIIENVIDDIGDESNMYQTVYIAVEPNQIKSVDNNGQFSEYNNDIFYSLESDGKTYSSFKEALDNTEGNSIDIVSNGVVIATFPATLDSRTVEGVINSLIVDGVLKPNKVVFNGKTYFQTTGETPSDRMISEEFFKDNIKQMISKSQYTVEAGLIDEGTMYQIVTDAVRNFFSGETVTSKAAPIDERNLKLNLMKILSDMGVSVMSLKQYQDKFKIKSQDIPPSAEALADVVNRVIAFKDGSLTLDNLTEEVMHLIVETLPAAQIEALSDLVRNSQEYQDNYENYNKVYKGDQKLVEKEILGKILKNISLNKTESLDQTLLARLYEILKNFFNGLTVSKTHRDQLKQLNSLVEKFVIEQNGESFNNDSLSQSREIALMYSLSDQVSNAQGAFAKTFSNITEFGHLNSYKKELNSKNFEDLRGKELAAAVSRLIEMSTKLIETTEAALKTAKNRGKSLSGQNLTILKDLDSEIRTTLVSLAGELREGQIGIENSEANKLAEKLSENAATISELRDANDRTTNDQINQMVDEVVEQMGGAESEFYRAEVEKVLRGQIDDTNYLFSFFGQLHHASNPILNMIGSKVWEMNMRSKQGTQEDAAEYLEYLKANPKLIKELETLFEKGYMTDVVDHRSFEDALLTKEMEAFSQISGESYANLDEYKLAKKDKTLPELGAKEGNYRTLLQEKQLEIIEPIMSQKYYRDTYNDDGSIKPVNERKGLFDKYEALDISGITQSFLKQNSADRGAIKANATKTYINEDGDKVTRVILSPEDNDNLNSISKIRKARKNIYSEISTIKDGLNLTIEKPVGVMSVQLPTGQYLSLVPGDVSEQAQMSFDLHKLDNAYMEQVQAEKGGANTTTAIAKANFIAYINSLGPQTNQELFDLIMSNLDVSLSQEFYDTINGDSFLKGDALEKLNPQNQDLVANVKELYAKRNAILAMYRNTSSPFEIDKLTDSDQKMIRSYSESISNALKILKLPESAQEEEEGQTKGEKAPNNAYRQALEKRRIVSGTKEELEFIKESQHASIVNINKVESAFTKSEQNLPLTRAEERLLDTYEGKDVLATQLNYARKNLQPYYTRFTPIGYKSIQERINAGEDTIEILANDDADLAALGILNDPYLNVRIDNSFEENNNPLKNPNYKDDYDGGFRQPKAGMFVNKDFISKFGINANGEATQNTQLFEARRLYLEARKKGLAKMEEKGANPYKAIQISKTKTEMIRQSVKGRDLGQNIKEIFKETLAYRVDDVAYGVKGFENSKVLPKYYTNDLENAEDVSTDHVYAMAQFLSRANEYKAKKEIIPDIDALYDVLLRGKRHSKSKDLKYTIAMADSYIENSIYGKIENRTYEFKVPGTDYSVDLAKVSRVFTKYVSLKNLGFNTTVPLTGYLSGMVSKKVEEYIGEKMNKESAALAGAEYKRLVKDGASQALDFQDNSKLFLIGQAFGIYDISEKARNAKYNKFQRTFSKSAMALHTLANYPIIPKIALAVMYDNRIINGKIVNKTQYFQEQNRAGVPQAQIAAAWKVAEDETMYKYMNFDKSGFTWSDDIGEIGGKIVKKTDYIQEQTKLNLDPKQIEATWIKAKENQKYLENRKLFMMKFIRNQVSIVDGTLPQEMKIAAQRDAIGSMLMLHKGFLSIFLQNRLKRRHLNIDTGLIEEGSYRTLTRLMADFFNTENGDRDMNNKFKKLIGKTKPPGPNATGAEWLEYELEMRNMKRIGKELAAMGILVTLGAIVFAMASDPDNEDIYALQMGSYLSLRLLNESAAAFTPAIVADLSSVIENPVVAYDSAKEMTQVWKVFDGDEIASGKYKGLSQRQRWITKNVIGVKGVYDIYGADNIRESEKTYRLYNEENINRSTLYLNALYKQAYKEE